MSDDTPTGQHEWKVALAMFIGIALVILAIGGCAFMLDHDHDKPLVVINHTP